MKSNNDYPCGITSEYFQQCVLYIGHEGLCDFTGFVTICKLLQISRKSFNTENCPMSYTVWISFDKPLTGLHYPPKGQKRSKDDIPLGELDGIFYTIGKLGDLPLPFATKKAAEEVAKFIPKSVVEKEDNL